jgi:predicted ArsR family transcriptional regulator
MRLAILEALQVHGDRTVASLARALRVTRSAIRHHLAALQADGLVTRRGVQLGKRRPSALYGLTPESESAFPQIYGEFATSVLAELHAGNVRDLHDVLRKVGDRWAAQDLPRVAGLQGHARLKRVRDILAERGFMPALERSRDGYELREYNCPVAPLAAGYVEICDMVHRWLERLLGVPVTRMKCMRQGEQYSIYRLDGLPASTSPAGRSQ